MSLLINPQEVTRVLLADGWHDVKRATFYLDSYEFGAIYENPPGNVKYEMSLSGGTEKHLAATGFSFGLGNNEVISGPITSVLAVATTTDDDE